MSKLLEVHYLYYNKKLKITEIAETLGYTPRNIDYLIAKGRKINPSKWPKKRPKEN